MTLRKFLQNPRIQALLNFATHPLFVLFIVNLVVYGVFIPLLGFYWDDIDFYWLHQHSGNAGLASYFATDGPVMGLFYQLNFSLLRDSPWRWQAFAFVWRWVSAAGVYFVIRQLWKDRREPAFFAAVVMLLYPGFSQQFIAICYGHFNLVLSALLFSLGLSLYVIEHPKHRIPLTLLSILLAVVNLASSEYFFMLELLRPVFIWVALRRTDLYPRQRIARMFKMWWPYLAAFLAVVVWRAFILKSQTQTYSFEVFGEFGAAPWNTLKDLLLTILKDIWWTAIAVWKKVVELPSFVEYGKKLTLFYVGISLLLAVILIFALFYRKEEGESNKESRNKPAFTMIVIGLIACLLAGIPFWLTKLGVSPNFPNDRFTLPFFLGSAFFITGVLFLLPGRPYARRALFIILLSLAGGLQSRVGLSAKRDWDILQRFMWQLTWRVPGIEPGTIVFSNELPLQFYSDLSLTAPLNLTYQTDPSQKEIPYVLYYPTVRKSNLSADTMEAGQDVEHGLWVGDFNGNTSRSFTLYYRPPSCLRIIDPEIEGENPLLPLYVTKSAQLTSDGVQLIKTTPDRQLVEPVFETEPDNQWCKAFETADLARQQQNWQQVTSIADQTLNEEIQTEDPAEYLVYIESYAHTETWQKSVELTNLAMSINPQINQPLCRLWQRIDNETPDSAAKKDALDTLSGILNCQP